MSTLKSKIASISPLGTIDTSYGQMEKHGVKFEGDDTTWEILTKGAGSSLNANVGEEFTYAIKKSVANGDQFNSIKRVNEEYQKPGGFTPNTNFDKGSGGDARQKSIEAQAATKEAASSLTMTGEWSKDELQKRAIDIYDVIQVLKNR